MKKILGNFTSQANNDFPLDCETLEVLKNNTQLCEMIGNIAGNCAILSGCVQNGAHTGEGYIFVKTTAAPHGEVLWFEGGSNVSEVCVVENAIPVTAHAVTYERAYTERYLAAGYGNGDMWDWSCFVRVKNLQELSGLIQDVQGQAGSNSGAIEGLQRVVNNQTTGVAALNTKANNNATGITNLNNAVKAIAQVHVGSILMWPSDTLPACGTYKLCDGSSLSTSDYAALFALIGTTYGGSGNTFNLPDMRGYFVAGKGATDTSKFTTADYSALGEKHGLEKVTLTADESGLPKHKHSYTESPNEGDVGSDPGDYGKRKLLNKTSYTSEVGGTAAKSAHENRPPFIVLNYIIKVK